MEGVGRAAGCARAIDEIEEARARVAVSEPKRFSLRDIPLLIGAVCLSGAVAFLASLEPINPAALYVSNAAADVGSRLGGDVVAALFVSVLEFLVFLLLSGFGWSIGYLGLVRRNPSSRIAMFGALFAALGATRAVDEFVMESVLTGTSLATFLTVNRVVGGLVFIAVVVVLWRLRSKDKADQRDEPWAPFDTDD